MTNDEFYDDLLTKQGSGWRKTLGMESGVAATRVEGKLIIVAAMEWWKARKAFLALPANDPSMRFCLDRLSDKETSLYRIATRAAAELPEDVTTYAGRIEPRAAADPPLSNAVRDALDVETGGSS